MAWKRILAAVALGKAAVAGAGAGLAILGAFNVAAAVDAHEMLQHLQHRLALDSFAVGGGILGIAIKLFAR